MRRHRHEEHLNHEAWAIPYADLMTLLLAFFVVMYAVSVVNEGKFRVMSESLIEAFNGSSHAIAPLPPTRIRPHNIAPAIAAPAGQSGSSIVPIAVPIPPHPVPASGGSGREAGHQSKQQENLGRIEDQVRKALQPLIDRKLVVVRHKPDWLEIEIRTDILFPSGVAQLSEPANAVLRDLAAILARFGNPLRVEGFTDDVPISNALYPSNWELSAARAASVARLFSMTGIAPARLGIIGWGEMRPIADNATVEGRNQNRRVLVVVMSDRPAAPRDHVTPDHVDEAAGLAASPAPDAEMMPTVRVSSGGNGTPDQGAGGAENPALPDAVAGPGGATHRINSSK
jgi:chemotaxis protein MotB